MTESILQKNWPWAIAASLVLIWFGSRFIGLDQPVDSLKPGTVADVEALATRDDLNVLFVLVDTLRSDRLGAYGYERDTSPEFDSLAKGGIRFGRHLAQSSWTKSSMASLWTGLYPSRVGVTRLDHGLPDEAVMPAEIFQEAGFRTVGIWRNGWVSPTFGFAQGFDVYDRPVPAPVPPGVRRANPTVQFGGSDFDAVASAGEFMMAAGDERWFAYLHLMDVHEYTYSHETALFGSSHSDIYDNSIRYVNDAYSLLAQALIASNNLERTIVVIAADHGEAFRERGIEGHARKVYRETTETPFIIGLPFELESDAVITSRTYNVDLWPTLLDLLGLPGMEETDGISRRPEILAALEGGPAPAFVDEIPGFAHLDQSWGNASMRSLPTVSVVDEPYRYVMSHEPDDLIREELFDSRADPAELDDILSREPEVTARLRQLAEDYLAREPVWEGEVPSLELDELEINHLRALGYALP
jgi:arylsulfatase